MVEEHERRPFWQRPRVVCYGTTFLILWMVLSIGWWRSNHSNPISYLRELPGRPGGYVLKQFIEPGMSRDDCEMILGEPS